MVARRSAQPLHTHFLARVIKIPAVQCHRAVTNKYETQFFSEGCRPGTFGNNFQWPLDRPKSWPWRTLSMQQASAMQQAWDAAIAAFAEFIAALVNGELIASGVHPASGVRCDLDPAEWTRRDLILDVRNGDLIDTRYGKGVRWSAITLRAAKQPRQKEGRGHGYDWEGAWAHATSLRAEDQWDWKQLGRDKKQPLPVRRKIVEDKIKRWFAAGGSTPDMSDIRQNITIPLYAGRRTRGKRKR